MRVLLDDEQVIEASSIIGNLEEYGKYTLLFSNGENFDMQFEYDDSISVEEAQERAKRIIKAAYEKGIVDCSNEPWDILLN